MLLDVDAVGICAGGGQVVLEDFVAAALRSRRCAGINVYTSVSAMTLPKDDRLHSKFVPKAALYAHRLQWWNFGFVNEVKRSGANVALCMTGAAVCRAVPFATFIQQSLPFSREALSMMGFTERLKYALMKAEMFRSVSGATETWVQTETMRKWVEWEFGRNHQYQVFRPSSRNLPRVRGGSQSLETMRLADSNCRLLYVGSNAGYKNLKMLARALALVRRSWPNATLFVTLPHDSLECQAEGVVGLGSLDETSLVEAYGLATALVMPSLVETVGLPMLEAMACGCPVISADRPYAWEMCGSAAQYFDPWSATNAAERIAEVLGSVEMRNTMAERGRRQAAKLRGENGYDRMIDRLVGWV